MPDFGLDRVEIEGFTSIVDSGLDLRALNVLVGANGAGKSNLVRVFELLGRIVDEDLQYYTRRTGGASQMISASESPKRLQIQIAGRGGGGENRYRAMLVPGPDNDVFFGAEDTYHRRPEYDTWWHDKLGTGHRESALHSRIGGRGRGQLVSSYVVEMLKGCRVYHFHDTSAEARVKASRPASDDLLLAPDAANLAAVLASFAADESGPGGVAYRRIVAAVRQVAPFFRDFILRPTPQGEIMLRWRQVDVDTVFSAHQMSDGTLRFICLTTLLLQPTLPALVVLDEPELGLHPFAIVVLADLLRQAAVRSQLLVATQSVTLMNQMALDDLVVVEREGGGSVFTRPDPARLERWLDEYSLGELWEKNLIGGRPGAPGSA